MRNEGTFIYIGNQCGGLLEIGHSTKNFLELSEAGIQVKATSTSSVLQISTFRLILIGYRSKLAQSLWLQMIPDQWKKLSQTGVGPHRIKGNKGIKLFRIESY